MRFSFLLLGAASANICGLTYERCGGIGFDGAACCSTVSECTFVNGYYSQCMPLQYGGSCSKRWEQCGGKGWEGSSCCTPDAACEALNEFYSQCKPLAEIDGDITGAPTAAPTASPTSAPAFRYF